MRPLSGPFDKWTGAPNWTLNSGQALSNGTALVISWCQLLELRMGHFELTMTEI